MALFNSSARIALITGANKGIGKEVARGLGKKGYIVLIGSRDAKNGEAVVNEFKKEDIQAFTLPLEVTKEESILEAYKWVEEKFGRLDSLVNNAGIVTEHTKPSEAELSEVKRAYETNVFAPIRMIQVFLPLLKKADAARIVNVSSGLGSLTVASDQSSEYSGINILGYCTTKTALNSVTVQFAKELRSTSIKVNSACPGHCATDLNNHGGPRTPTQGASVIIDLASLPVDGASGGFFNEDGIIPW